MGIGTGPGAQAQATNHAQAQAQAQAQSQAWAQAHHERPEEDSPHIKAVGNGLQELHDRGQRDPG